MCMANDVTRYKALASRKLTKYPFMVFACRRILACWLSLSLSTSPIGSQRPDRVKFASHALISRIVRQCVIISSR